MINGIEKKISLVAQTVKHLPIMQETQVRKILWRRKWQPTPVLFPGKSHGWQILAGYSLWGLKELDTTERLQYVRYRRQNSLNWAIVYTVSYRQHSLSN